jgi:hypothetical protein
MFFIFLIGLLTRVVSFFIYFRTYLRQDQRLLVILRTTLDLAGKKALSGAAFEVVQCKCEVCTKL